MVYHIVFGALAAYGMLCFLWTWLGCFFSRAEGGCVVCMCPSGVRQVLFLRRIMLLRQLGLMKTPVYILGQSMDQEVADLMKNEDFVFVTSVDSLTQMLELERKNFD